MYYQKEYADLTQHKIPLVKTLISKDIFEGDFNDCKLPGEDLVDAYLPYSKFKNGNLHQAQLKNAILNNSRFDLSNLSLSNLEGANLYFASFFRANLAGANLTDANLQYANLSYVNLR